MKSVLVKFQNLEAEVALPLPAFVGGSVAADLLIPSLSVHGKLAFALVEENGLVVIRSARSGDLVNPLVLERYGIRILGLIDAHSRPNFIRTLRARERQWSGQLPQRLRTLALLHLPDWIRYPLIFGALVVLTSMIFRLSSSQESVKDESDFVKTLSLGVKHPDYFGNVRQNQSHPRGVIFEVDLTAEDLRHRAILTFAIAGLDKPREVVALLNDQEIYGSEIEERCIKKGCDKSIKIRQGLLKEGRNRIEFRHLVPESPWLLAMVQLRGQQPLTALEAERVQEFLKMAQDYYAIRKIAAINLIYAQERISRIEGIIADRFLETELESSIMAVKASIDEDLVELENAAWDLIDTRLRIKDFDGAAMELENLSKIFPDPSTPVGLKIMKKRQEINSLK